MYLFWLLKKAKQTRKYGRLVAFILKHLEKGQHVYLDRDVTTRWHAHIQMVFFVTATILTLLLKDSVMALLLYNVKLLNYSTVRTRICTISYNLTDYVQHTLKLPRCQFHLFLLLLCCYCSPSSLLLSLYHCLSHSPLFPSLSVYYSVHHLQ